MESNIIIISKDELEHLIGEAVLKSMKMVSVPKDKNNCEWVTRVETSHLLQISLPTLDKLTKEGKFKVHHIGRKKFYDKNEINNSIKK